jgi:hypothetical protein
MNFLVLLIFENDDPLKERKFNTLNRRGQTRTTYETDIAGGHEERDTGYCQVVSID